MRTRVACAALLLIAAALPARAATHLVDEIKLGAIAHDVPIGGHRVEKGVDMNGEVLFASPGFLQAILAPRPHLGIMANTQGLTSYAYAGLTWSATLVQGLFGSQDGIVASLGLGGAVHDGPNTSSDSGKKGLGTRLLFHEYVELGYRVAPRYTVSLFLDHVSNADIGRRNPGLTNLGLRLGIGF